MLEEPLFVIVGRKISHYSPFTLSFHSLKLSRSFTFSSPYLQCSPLSPSPVQSHLLFYFFFNFLFHLLFNFLFNSLTIVLNLPSIVLLLSFHYHFPIVLSHHFSSISSTHYLSLQSFSLLSYLSYKETNTMLTKQHLQSSYNIKYLL